MMPGAPGLAVPVWRTAHRVHPLSERGSSKKGVVAHAVRGLHTLCGLTVHAVKWADDQGEAPLCPTCHKVPLGHATSADLTELGLTYRQLDHWCSKGWLRPDGEGCGSGSRRTFPEREWRCAVLMAVLVRAGVSPVSARRAAVSDGWLGPNVQVTVYNTVDAPGCLP